MSTHIPFLVLICSLTACSSVQQVEGKFSTVDNQPLLLSDSSAISNGDKSQALNPGALVISVTTANESAGTLRPIAITLPTNTELTLNKSDWQNATHFSKAPVESGWRYAIHGEWQQLTSGIVEHEERVDCEAYGYCTKNAIILDCPQGRFIEGTAGYYEQLGNNDCRHSSSIESGQFSNCPGKQNVKIRSRNEQYQLILQFTELDSTATPRGEFLGKTAPADHELEREVLGDCQLY